MCKSSKQFVKAIDDNEESSNEASSADDDYVYLVNQSNKKGLNNNIEFSDDESYIYAIKKQLDAQVKRHYVNKVKTNVNVRVKGTNVKMRIDTCSGVNVIDSKTFAKLPCDIKLNKANIQLYGYSSKVKKVLGRFTETIETKKGIAVAEFVVVAGNNGSLITAEIAVALNLIQFTTKLTSKDSMFKDIIFNEYNDVFTGIGKLKNFKAELHIDENVTPKI